MSEPADPNYQNWLLRIRKDLRKMVEEEAAQERRTPPAQIEQILLERYGMPVLTGGDVGKVQEKVRKGGVGKAAKRPRKGNTTRKAIPA